MESVRKLEGVIAGWYKQAPHLPQNGRKWLAANAWWIVLIGVILGAVGLFMALSAVLFAGAFLTSVAVVDPGTAAATGALGLIAIVTLAFSAVTVIIEAMAIKPLKDMQKKGWTLIFIAMLISVVALVVSAVLSYNLFGLIWGLLWSAVWGYFLFEVREQYGTAHVTNKPEAKKA